MDLLPLIGVGVVLFVATRSLHRLLRCRKVVALGLGGLTSLVVVLPGLRLPWEPLIRAVPRGAVADGDVWIAFGFGLNPGPTAGASNRALAEWVLAHNQRRERTVVQQGVYLALKEIDPRADVDAWVVCLPHRDGVYVDTTAAALQAWAILAEHHCRRPVLIAHDLQLARMTRTFERLGFGAELIVPDLPPTPFDRASMQSWTRSREAWLMWELFFARPLTFASWGVVLLGIIAVVVVGRWLRG